MTDWAKLSTQSNPSQSQSADGSITKAIDPSGKGVFNLPVIGGLARNTIDAGESYGRMVGGAAFETGAGVGTLLGSKEAANAKNPFLSQKDVQTFSHPQSALTEATGRSLNAALSADGLSSLPGLAKSLPAIIKNAPNTVRMLTPKGAGQAIEKAHTAATERGVSDTLSNVLTEAKQAIEDKFGSVNSGDPALKNAFGKMVQHITGTDISPRTLANFKDFQTFQGELTPSQLVKARQTIVRRYGYNPENGNIDQKVADVFRDVLSKRAKDITPNLAQADSAYARTQKLKDMLPAVAKSIGIPAAAGVGYGLLNVFKGGDNQP